MGEVGVDRAVTAYRAADWSVAELLQVIVVAVVWDVLLTPFVLPPLMKLFGRLDPQRMTA